MSASRETCDYPNCHEPAAGNVGRYKVCARHKREFEEFEALACEPRAARSFGGP